MQIVKILSMLLVSSVLVAGISIPMVPEPQSMFEFPLLPGIGETARILFFHVPAAWVSVIAFGTALFFGIRYLHSKRIDDDRRSVSAAGIGVLFCLLAAITGSLWARVTWGAFWNWDPRETSIFILLLIYGAYFALRSALSSDEIRARLSAAYAIIAGCTVPFFVFIMPRMTDGLHPGGRGDMSGSIPVQQLHLPVNMQIVFFLGLFGFTCLFIWILHIRIRIARLECQLSIKEL